MALAFNTNHDNKLSKVTKSMERWLMDTLKCEKNDNVFHGNHIAQIISEICGISKWQFFKIKRSRSSSRSKIKVHIPWQLWAKILVSSCMILVWSLHDPRLDPWSLFRLNPCLVLIFVSILVSILVWSLFRFDPCLHLALILVSSRIILVFYDPCLVLSRMILVS